MFKKVYKSILFPLFMIFVGSSSLGYQLHCSIVIFPAWHQTRRKKRVRIMALSYLAVLGLRSDAVPRKNRCTKGSIAFCISPPLLQLAGHQPHFSLIITESSRKERIPTGANLFLVNILDGWPPCGLVSLLLLLIRGTRIDLSFSLWPQLAIKSD